MIETNAILAINSLDRYTTQNTNIFTQVGQNVGSPATQNYSLVGSYQNSAPYSNDFQITTPGTLTYGYISKIVLSQIQLQYNIPTVNDNFNALFFLGVGAPLNNFYPIQIPTGFYSPQELAAIITLQIDAVGDLNPYNFLVVYDPELHVFRFTTQAGVIQFEFPDLQALITFGASTSAELNEILKTYKLLGIGNANSFPNTNQVSELSPNLLYTPYIDIYSNALTAYQKLSDGNSTVARPKGLIARVYLSGVGGPQITLSTEALGSRPFVATIDLNTPKVIKWTKDVAINSIDFQMRDCYGDLLPGQENGYQTEFQITLLCIEGEQE